MTSTHCPNIERLVCHKSPYIGHIALALPAKPRTNCNVGFEFAGQKRANHGTTLPHTNTNAGAVAALIRHNRTTTFDDRHMHYKKG